MSRPSQIDEQRKRLLPFVTEVFSEFGYHRTTTSLLAHRCEVRENILYRLWQDKKSMFLAAIDEMFRARAEKWGEILAANVDEPIAETLISHETRHLGEFGFYRVVFTALVEADDPEIRAAIKAMYMQFHRRVREVIDTSRRGKKNPPTLDSDATAWVMIGLATMSNVIRELEIVRPIQRRDMFVSSARYLVDGSV